MQGQPDMFRDPITVDQTKAAMADKIKYPQTLKSHTDDPVQNQVWANVTWDLLKEPKKTKNGYPMYGVLKVRGTWPTNTDAVRQASDIIRNQDSNSIILTVPVGHLIPITSDPELFRNDLTEVKIDKDDFSLHDEVAKQKEADAKKKAKEIRDRVEDVKKDPSMDDPAHLDYYVKKRVVENQMVDFIGKLRKQIDELTGKQSDLHKELANLEFEHSEYVDCWVDRYNEERTKAGINPFVLVKEDAEKYEHRMAEYRC